MQRLALVFTAGSRQYPAYHTVGPGSTGPLERAGIEPVRVQSLGPTVDAIEAPQRRVNHAVEVLG